MLESLLISLSFIFSGNAAPQYNSRLWQTDDGLPHNTVQAITQTRDGYLWVATADGLARFDGLRFTVWDQKLVPKIKTRWFTALHEDRDGGLWNETGASSHW